MEREEKKKKQEQKRKKISGFMEFIRTQGVVGLAVGFLLGGAVSKVVSSLIEDIVNPVLAVILGAVGGLEAAVLQIGPIALMWGSFLSSVIDFIVIALIVYFGVKGLGLEKLDKKKE